MALQTVAVIGSGLMGRGIAYVSAVGGFATALYDVSGAALDKALDRIRKDLDEGVARAKLTGPDAEAAQARLEPATSLEAAASGADFVIEAVGADAVAPKLEAGPDPTGILPLRQAYEMTAPGGHIVTTSLPRGTLSLPAVLFTIGGRTHHAGQAGGCNPMRDIPRFVELLDKGQFNARALATSVVPIERMLDAYQDVAYRTTVTAIMTA